MSWAKANLPTVHAQADVWAEDLHGHWWDKSAGLICLRCLQMRHHTMPDRTDYAPDI